MFSGSLLCELLQPAAGVWLCGAPKTALFHYACFCVFIMRAIVFALYSFDINVYMHIDKAELCFKDSTLIVQKGFLL